MTKDYSTSEASKQLFAVFYLWYEGDSNLVDDSFCGIATSLESAVNIAKSLAGERPFELFMPGQPVPNDGSYGDERLRYRIAVVTADAAYEDDCEYARPSRHQPAAQEQGDSLEALLTSFPFKNCKSLESLPDFSQAKEAWDSIEADWQAVFAACRSATEPANEREKRRERRAFWQRIQKLLCADN